MRAAVAADADWIRDTAADVYRALGDYGVIIPSWLDHPGVVAFVHESEGLRQGFTMLGFYTPEGGVPGAGPDEPPYVVDLLAIAVAPEHQGQGLGREMLHHAIATARAEGARRDVRELRLTVAEGNTRALRLFRDASFEIVQANYGRYDGGQRAIRMAKPLWTGRT